MLVDLLQSIEQFFLCREHQLCLLMGLIELPCELGSRRAGRLGLAGTHDMLLKSFQACAIARIGSGTRSCELEAGRMADLTPISSPRVRAKNARRSFQFR